MNKRIFTTDFKPTPYWWDGCALADNTHQVKLPEQADVVVVGSGYTGLHAAIETARAGLSTVVLDAQALGFGCSTRNGGQISTSVKGDYPTLCKHYGEELGYEILMMGQSSLNFIDSFVHEEKIECDFQIDGRFHGAHSAREFRKLSHHIDTPNPAFDDGAYMVSRSEQRTELGTDVYYGGVVYPHYASIDPARYHNGCLLRAGEAGAIVKGHCAVNNIASDTSRFAVKTECGVISAREVVIATNGYTGNLTPWLRRRVIPIGSYIIATDKIAPELMDSLFPTNRVLTDSRRLVYYYRPSPDRKRVLFGGRVSLFESDPVKSGVKLHAELVRLFPPLKTVKVSHSWVGTVAYTFDIMAHSGVDKGLHYAMGYCGSGVGMASYLGHCMGRKIAGTCDPHIPMSRIEFPTRPLYTGRPWFLAPSIGYFRVRDYLKW